MSRILIIEDEIDIQNFLKDVLESVGYQVTTACDGMDGFTLFQREQFDLILLDIMMPKIDGYVVLEMIRKESDVPVIMLTAMGQEKDQVKGFDLKADDYIVKPSSAVLILKRIEAALRRVTKPNGEIELSNKTLIHKELSLNTESCEVYISGKQISLTYLEYEMLKMFLENKNRVISREQLLNTVWGIDFYGDEKIVNVHIMNIRKKLGVDYIETVRGMGYKINE